MTAGHMIVKRTIRLEWKPQDCWIGIYWHNSQAGRRWHRGAGPFDVWACMMPMLPIHYRCQRTWVCGT